MRYLSFFSRVANIEMATASLNSSAWLAASLLLSAGSRASAFTVNRLVSVRSEANPGRANRSRNQLGSPHKMCSCGAFSTKFSDGDGVELISQAQGQWMKNYGR